MLFITCKYDDTTCHNILSKYEGFLLTEPHQEDKLFYSGDPVKDYKDANAYAYKRTTLTRMTCSLSSSVDHFVKDCKGLIEWFIDDNGFEIMRYAEKN